MAGLTATPPLAARAFWAGAQQFVDAEDVCRLHRWSISPANLCIFSPKPRFS
jgi:hypothetical protein